MDQDGEQKSVDDDQNAVLGEALLGVLISIFVINIIILICLFIICLKRRKIKPSTTPERVSDNAEAEAVPAGAQTSAVTVLDPALLSRPVESQPSTRANNDEYQMDPRDFYIQSLRRASMNNWRNYSITGTTGSATSLDSGLGYTSKTHYGTKYKIKARVHAEDDRSFTSESGNFEFRKLTLSESQTISDVWW